MKALIMASLSSLSFSSHTGDTGNVFITAATTKRFFRLVFMKSSIENTFLILFSFLLLTEDNSEWKIHTWHINIRNPRRCRTHGWFALKRVTEDIPYHWQWSVQSFEEHRQELLGRAQILQAEKELQEEIQIPLLLSRDPEKVILHR